MTNATTGDQVDDRVGDLEVALCDLFGVPIDIPVAAPGFLWDATGLKKIILKDNAADPSGAGQLARNGDRLLLHDGVAVRQITNQIIKDVTEPAVANSSIEASLYSQFIQGGVLGTAQVLHGTVSFFVGTMLPGATVSVRLYYGGQLFFNPVLFNNTASQQGVFGLHCQFRIHARNSATSQVASARIEVAPINPALNFGPTSAFSTFNLALISANSAIDQTLQVNILWSAASASNSIQGVGLLVWR